MAVFGFHLVLTLVAATVFSKLSVRFSFCDFFIFKGLYYYLLEGSLLPKFNSNKNVGRDGHPLKRKKRNNHPKEQAEREDRLFRLPLTSAALEGVPFFDSLIWTVNYSCFALALFAISDAYNWLFPQNRDLNTSMIWAFCALILQAHVLMRIALEKASAPELFPERNMLICALGLFFLCSMVLNAFADRLIDLDFVGGYTTFLDGLNEFVHRHGFEPLFSEGARSPVLLLVCLSLLFATIGAALFFPVLQSTSLQMDVLEAGECSVAKKLLLHTSFFAPAAAILLFLKPVVDQILEAGLINHEQLRAGRIAAIILMALLRVAISKSCLQAFLDQPKRRLLDYRQRELKDEEKQRKVANFASYTAITTLQFYLPTAIYLSVALILKHFGNISFWSLFTGLPSSEMPNQRDEVTRILIAREVQEPLWTLMLVTFLSIQFITSLIGLVGQRAFL